jgi:hypothetical protein
MVAPRGIPLRVLMAHFLPGLEGVRRIRDTFRTPTGRRYGPDFIDRGLEIGRRLHEALMQKIDAGVAEAPLKPRRTPGKG